MISYNIMQGETVNTFSKSNLKSIGFTGVEVFNETVEDVFKGTTAEESFLYITVTDTSSKFINKIHCPIYFTILADNKTILAENPFFPSNFTSIDLPEAKLTAANFLLSSNDTITVSITANYSPTQSPPIL